MCSIAVICSSGRFYGKMSLPEKLIFVSQSVVIKHGRRNYVLLLSGLCAIVAAAQMEVGAARESRRDAKQVWRDAVHKYSM